MPYRHAVCKLIIFRQHLKMFTKVRGLCLGMMAGTATYASAFGGVWLLTDWEKEAQKAAVRAGVTEPLMMPDNLDLANDAEAVHEQST